MRVTTKGKLGSLIFQFNPTTINYSGGGWNWAEINSPGMAEPMYNPSYGKTKNISFELYYNELADQVIHPTDFEKSMKQLRDTLKPVVFSYGAKAYRVIVSDLTYVGSSYDKNLHMYESTYTVTLIVIG
jgi:hypothetical protein